MYLPLDIVLYSERHKKFMTETQRMKEPSVLELVEKIKHTLDSKEVDDAVMKFMEKGGNVDRLLMQIEFHLRLPLGDKMRDRLITYSDKISKIKSGKP